MTDFEARIGRLGLAHDLPKIKDLVIADNETVYVSHSEPTIAGARWLKDAGRMMKPKDFDQLKEWIGVPDATAAKVPHAPTFRRRRVPAPHLVAHHDHATKVDYARAYVFGDSTKIARLPIELSEILQHIVIHFARDIVVGHNATLVYGPDNHSVQARHIKIHTGGQIRVNSYMSINCTSLAAKLA
ncbi:MAG: hypothetical protein IPL61_33360 [Myxococcales bacterium]|nr:hypothetical protein [Myxococcales bacterium]